MFETIRDLTIAFLFTILTMVTMRGSALAGRCRSGADAGHDAV